MAKLVELDRGLRDPEIEGQPVVFLRRHPDIRGLDDSGRTVGTPQPYHPLDIDTCRFFNVTVTKGSG